MKAANPYLNFAGNTEEAFTFYKSVFGGEFVGGVRRFRDFGDDNPMGIAEEELDEIAHVALPIGENNILMGTDALESLGQSVTVGKNYYIALEADTEEECERVFSELAQGGETEMELQKTEWAEKYGICSDRFGIQWMVMYTGDVEFAGGSAE